MSRVVLCIQMQVEILFGPFLTWNWEKTFENIRKNCILSYYLKLVNMQTLADSLRGYLKFVFFQLIFSWKRPKKVFQPAFGCVQHPKTGQNKQQDLLLHSIEWETGQFIFSVKLIFNTCKISRSNQKIVYIDRVRLKHLLKTSSK